MNPTEKSNVQLRESIESKDVARISLGINLAMAMRWKWKMWWQSTHLKILYAFIHPIKTE